MTGTCTECGLAIQPHTSVIAGIEREGKILFLWACEHNPIGDAAVVLSSMDCVSAFLSKHPEHVEAIGLLLEADKKC